MLTIQQCYNRIRDIEKLNHDWDALGSPAPSVGCINVCYTLMDIIQAVTCPDKIEASCEGGVSFIWCNENNYSSLEIDNDSNVICGRSINNIIEVYEGDIYNSIKWCIEI